MAPQVILAGSLAKSPYVGQQILAPLLMGESLTLAEKIARNRSWQETARLDLTIVISKYFEHNLRDLTNILFFNVVLVDIATAV